MAFIMDTDTSLNEAARWNELSSTLALAGFEPSDFELEDGAPSEFLLGLDLPGRLITVRRRSTGHRQIYAVSPGCPWLFTAFADLTAGRFGVPR